MTRQLGSRADFAPNSAATTEGWCKMRARGGKFEGNLLAAGVGKISGCPDCLRAGRYPGELPRANIGILGRNCHVRSIIHFWTLQKGVPKKATIFEKKKGVGDVRVIRNCHRPLFSIIGPCDHQPGSCSRPGETGAARCFSRTAG